VHPLTYKEPPISFRNCDSSQRVTPFLSNLDPKACMTSWSGQIMGRHTSQTQLQRGGFHAIQEDNPDPAANPTIWATFMAIYSSAALTITVGSKAATGLTTKARAVHRGGRSGISPTNEIPLAERHFKSFMYAKICTKERRACRVCVDRVYSPGLRAARVGLERIKDLFCMADCISNLTRKDTFDWGCIPH